MIVVVKKDVLKLLDAGIMYPISDSKWFSPMQVVLKKGGMNVVKNKKGESITIRTIKRWCMCIYYIKFNKATRKYHLSLPFINQMLKHLAKHYPFCYLSGSSRSSFSQVIKRIQPSHALMVHLPSVECHFGYAMHLQPFSSAWYQSSLTSYKISRKSLWMIVRCAVRDLMHVWLTWKEC